jgi:S1/P1 Nuclease
MANEPLTDGEKDYPFVEAAPFADVIKYKGGGWQSNWHFVDIPYFDQGGNMNDFPDFKLDPKNISEAIPGITDWLQGKAGYQNSFAYTTIMNAVKNDEQKGKSYAVRLLIHYLGDIHQPMHALSRINKAFPAGDRGGNDFPLPGHYSIKELHAAWDSVLYEFHVNDKLPYDATNWAKLGSSADKLRSRFSIAPSEYSSYDPKAWAKQTFQVGADNAYSGKPIGF